MIIQLAADLQDGAGRLLRASPSPPPSPLQTVVFLLPLLLLMICSPVHLLLQLKSCLSVADTVMQRGTAASCRRIFGREKNRPPGVLPSERLDVDFDSMIHV